MSPRFKARLAGVFYLLMIGAGGLATFARRGIVVNGDAAATTANILAHESRFQLWFTGDLLVVAFYLGVTAILCDLLRPVSRTLSRVAAFSSLVGCATQACAALFVLAPLSIMRNVQQPGAMSLEQRQALAYLLLKLYTPAYGIAVVFFGLFCILIGCLIFRSAFLPRILGILMTFAGLAWMTFLYPPLAMLLYPRVTLILAGLGEGSLMLWLLAIGLNAPKWQEKAARSTDPAERGG